LIAPDINISYSSPIVGLRLYLDHIGYKVQESDRELGQVQAHFGPSWFRKRWRGDGNRNRKDYQRGKSSLKITHPRYLTRAS